jgi:broad specificity phosphatase PhoE
MTERNNTTIDLLRHGEPEGGRMFRGGGTDHPLSQTGWQQMSQSVEARIERNRQNWDAIVSSPMLRCQAFASRLANSLELPLD